jgi:formate dehydrogenase subunit beta
MSDLTGKLRDVARSLLSEAKVDLVIGFERGTMPLRATPCFVSSADDVDRLVWDASCENSLSSYLLVAEGRVAIVAKGCDARSIVGLLAERQVARDQVLIIGVPCMGMLDRGRIETQLRDREILEAVLDDGEVVVRGERSDGSPFEERLSREDYLLAECVTCACRTPPMYDILVGEAAVAETADRFSDVEELETLDAQERWAYFQREFDRCIRCYACRQACPMCYCEECFIDQTQPNWFGKTDEFSDTMIFHVVRAFHLAGRCVDCGACGRACPMDIDLQAMNRKLIKDVKETYGYQAGLDPEAHPLLSTFEPDDPQEFIK